MEGAGLFIMGLIVFVSLVLGITGGIMTMANIAKGKESNAKRPQPNAKKTHNRKKKSKKQRIMEEDGVTRVDSIVKDRLVISRALNDDKSQTEFNCLADGIDTTRQISKQRERSNNSYNILSNKLYNAPATQTPHQDYGLAANQLNNDAVINQANQMYMHNQQ